MDTNDSVYRMENAYLDSVLDFLKKEIAETRSTLELKKTNLYNARREQGVLVSDVTNAGLSSDLSQHLLEDERQLASIENLSRRLMQDERLLVSPYFGRFDFVEDGENTADKIYIGLHNVYDSASGNILVYDWRAPISSIFYRCEPGKAIFTAPGGEISGDLTLKRQYSIENSKLQYFFDCSLYISDDILKEVLGHNASPIMQNIVRTIQSEQDKIIRDTKSDLLIAQGAAGSGKTTIALHRIAYLLYNSVQSGLTSDNIMIISLSDVFGKYISTVLPQLGEKNVRQTTFEGISASLTQLTPKLTKNEFVDSLFVNEKKNPEKAQLVRDAYLFKGSRVFTEILSGFLNYYENNLIPFEDVVYDGKTIAKAAALKKLYLEDTTGMPPLSRLRRIENMLKSKIDIAQRLYHKKLEEEIIEEEDHKFDYKTVARYRAIKESNRVLGLISHFTKFSALDVYRALFDDKERFFSICQGFELPDNIAQIIDYTNSGFKSGIGFDDTAPISYLTLLLDKTDLFEDVKQVVIDEAQDYLPIHYAIFGIIFKSAAFTVLGDICQAVETEESLSIYDDVKTFINKKNPEMLTLNKSYRCSYEIMKLAMKLEEKASQTVPFERHEKEPEFISIKDSELDEKLAADIKICFDEGFDTCAVICKTAADAQKMFDRLRTKINVSLIGTTSEVGHGISVIPAYLAKGLEFDCVFIPDVSDKNYDGLLSKRLLYIAATRALHRLSLYYNEEGNIIKLLKN